MTPAEAEKVIRVISGAWGYFASDAHERVALWSEHLDQLDFEPARAAARRLAETCDQLPSLAEFLRTVREEERLARLAASAPTLAPNEGTYACRCGELRGWVVVEAGNPPTLRPCPTCRPDAATRHQGGHWAPDHTCSACERRRRGVAA